jgi:hypothetical protein
MAHVNRATKRSAATSMPIISAILLSSDDESGAMLDSTSMMGTPSTVTPSAAEAASAVPRLEESEVCMSSTFMEAGTAMVAVMSTLAAATLIVTSDLPTPAALATFCCKLDLSLSE